MIGKQLDKSANKYSTNLGQLLKRILSECTFDDTLMLSVLELLKHMHAVKNKDIVELTIKKIFTCSPERKGLVKWAPDRFPRLAHLLIDLMSSYALKNRAFVYKNIIRMFIKLEIDAIRYFQSKLDRVEAQKQVIAFITDDLANDRHGVANKEFLSAFSVTLLPLF